MRSAPSEPGKGTCSRFNARLLAKRPRHAWCWSRGISSYWLANIVPIEIGELGRARYNAILRDFLDLIGNAAADKAGATVELTKPRQGLEDWLSAAAAKALWAFSSCANKLTGSSHPADRERWYDFIIKAHGRDGKLNTDRLGRWLIEVERWPEYEAHDLVSEYEFGWVCLIISRSTDADRHCSVGGSQCSHPLLRHLFHRRHRPGSDP